MVAATATTGERRRMNHPVRAIPMSSNPSRPVQNRRKLCSCSVRGETEAARMNNGMSTTTAATHTNGNHRGIDTFDPRFLVIFMTNQRANAISGTLTQNS